MRRGLGEDISMPGLNADGSPNPTLGGDGYYQFASDMCQLPAGIINPPPTANPWCPNFDPNFPYVYTKPYFQVKGINPASNTAELWQLDAYGIPVARFNTVTMNWDSLQNLWPTNLPLQGRWQEPISSVESQAGIQTLTDTLFTPFTEYIRFGDEPQILDLVVDLKKNLPADTYDQLYTFMQLFPRMNLRDWFDNFIAPSLPFDVVYKTYVGAGGGYVAVDSQGNPILDPGSPGYVPPQNVVNPVPVQDWAAFGIRGAFEANRKSTDPFLWAGFINTFNQANLDYCNQHQIAPWDWEDQKSRLFLTSQNQSQMKQLQDNFNAYKAQIFGTNPQVQDLINRYMTLPKLGDLGLEVSRQSVFKELLQQGEFDTAEAIIVAYQAAQSTVLDAGLKSKIPVNVVTASGRQIFATPPGQST